MREPDRRSFLKVAGVGTGIAWVTPQILSAPAASAATTPPPAPPQFVSAAGDHDPSGGPLTVTVGTGLGQLDVLAGDFLLALTAVHIDDGNLVSFVTPSGFSPAGTQDARDSGGQNPGVRTQLFTHVVAALDTTYTFDLNVVPPVASAACTVLIVGYRGGVSLDPASPATSFALTGATSISVGPLAPSIPEVTTVAIISAENPEVWAAAPAPYTLEFDYTPNTSVPEIYVADANLNSTSVPSVTFTETTSGHPEAAWLIGVSPL